MTNAKTGNTLPRHNKNSNSKSKTSSKNPEKIKSGPIDLSFLLIIVVLLVMGIVLMFSAGYAWAISEGLEGTYYVKRQIGMAIVGLIGMLVVSFIDYHIIRKPWIVFGAFGVSIVLLILCLVGPFASPHNNSYRWIDLKIFPEFQPSEVAKFALILLFAYFISANYTRLKDFKYGIIPFVVGIGIIAALLLQEVHLSATIIICAIGFIMMFVGGSKVSHLVLLVIGGLAAMALVLFISVNLNGVGYIQDRVTAWIDPFNPDNADKTYQTRNSLIAIGSGGIFGLGIGNSRQKFLYLPESKNDFVFSVACEELGIIGAVVIISLFLLFVIRGFHIASKAPDKFGMMLAVGLTVQIGLQAFLNFAVVTNTIPNTGISLPFFSYGGTALIMQLVQMGFVLNISRQAIIKV